VDIWEAEVGRPGGRVRLRRTGSQECFFGFGQGLGYDVRGICKSFEGLFEVGDFLVKVRRVTYTKGS
jgi:hypothetical protein